MSTETKIYPCKELSERILEASAKRSEQFERRLGRKPRLAVVLVGTDPASEVYVGKKTETCRKYGIDATDYRLDPSEGEEKLVALIRSLNDDERVDGILVQSPLPKGWNEQAVQSLIAPSKDVDGFHPLNAGLLAIDAKRALENGLPPCTPAGVMEVLKENKINLQGANAVVVGRSNIVGKPMALMLLAADATVTVCHSRTKNLKELCRSADIIVSAIGRKEYIDASFVKEGAAVIDVGINRAEFDGKRRIFGDVDRASVTGKASFLTPVPNGIGPMTIALLIRNTVRAAENRARGI